MSGDLAATALTKFRAFLRESRTPHESRSGSVVRHVSTADGQTGVLKVTPASLGPHALSDARRELRFYRQLATSAPIHTPRLLEWMDAENGVAILLEDAGEPRHVTSWTTDMWADLGRDLALLHSMPLPTGDWHRPDALRDALAAPNLDAITSFWASTLPHLSDLINRRDDLANHIAALPPVFIHGDCHPSNIVHTAGALAFCDWQSSGIGRPTADLAFLNVRTTPDGVTAPPALTNAYLQHRASERDTLRRALLAEELAILVFVWPPYARYHAPLGIARIRRRAHELAEQWRRA